MTLDFSKYGTPEGKKELANELIEAVRKHGFFYVKNFNISQERVNRQFSIGKQFYEIPLEEKLKYVPDGLGRSRIASIIGLGSHLPPQTTAPSTVMYLPVAGCKSHIESASELISMEDSLDAASGLRDRVEIYNIPSK